MKKSRAAFNIWTLLAAFFILLPTMMGFYHGDRGRIVAAATWVDDPNFSQTVLFMFDQGWEKASALVLNRPYPDLSLLPTYLNVAGVPVYWGGPVEDRDRVFVMEITDGKKPVVSAFDAVIQNVPDILDRVKASPDRYRIFVGFAGWEPGQFELEKKNNVWLVSDYAPYVFDKGMDAKTIWQKALSLSKDKKKPRIVERQKG